ncbi:CBS domain-containing protein [Thermotalea metallivorans]|uniref:Hypoxic response protein 1 n=1 Tax=Thermotalea metallivorans TaxID=520762 RepID=A0A140LEI7_9FIRM|nr:CBS domain-containing protein [Thermotalea metallivorans]KXG78962.1 Hypoxic response protein 1 [Thermotalea metallivorans]
MRVRDLMTSNVSVASPNTPVHQVAKQMKDLNVGSIPICDQDRHALGIVTDRDIVIRSVSQGNMNASAGDVMTSNLVYATPDMDAHEAAALMAKHQVRRLPVVENGKIVGILAIGDLATVNIYVNEAGDALSSISKPSAPQM